MQQSNKKMVINLSSMIEVHFSIGFNAFFEVRFKLDLKANGGDNALISCMGWVGE